MGVLRQGKRLTLLQEVQEMREHIASAVEREKVIQELKKSLKVTRQQLEESTKTRQVVGIVMPPSDPEPV